MRAFPRAVCPLFCAFAALAAAGCSWNPEPPREQGAFRFAVFGDGPYGGNENGRFRRVVAALNARPVAFVLHVGDIMSSRCSDSVYRDRRRAIDAIQHPVIYTPGDNEWSDCVDSIVGPEGDPLDRLASLRRIFFDAPNRSIGATPLSLESQAGSADFGEFVEHARWFHGGVAFVTVHVVGTANGGRRFAGRAERHDEEVRRRTAAAVAWLYESFEAAVRAGASAMVVAFHAQIFDADSERDRAAFAPLHEALLELATHIGLPVLVVHGDGHTYTVDRPLRDPASGATIANLQRLETFGSPDIGWVDVVVSPGAKEPFRFEPNVTPRWLWW